jgi:hypothetical protein
MTLNETNHYDIILLKIFDFLASLKTNTIFIFFAPWRLSNKKLFPLLN